MNKFNSMMAVALLALTFTACKKDKEEPIIEVPPSDGSTLTLEGKTAESNYTNVAYADLSADKTTKVDRKSWALGFYCGAEFKVVLNQSFQTLASVVNKTDINAVTLDDAKANPVYSYNPQSDNPVVNGVNMVDDYKGSLTRTAIAAVSATESENKVYILGLNGTFTEPNLYKVRILRNGNGYTLQYAKVGETTFKTVGVSKNTDYNFAFVSLGNSNDGAVVNAEPKKAEWDLHWSYSVYTSVADNYQANPYFYQDFVTTNNLGGVTVAEIVTTNTTYTYGTFTESNLADAIVKFSSDRDAIGSKWRNTATGVKADRFYILKDGSGNYYKLKFVSMTAADGGERGKPVIEYKLVKKG